MGLIVPVLKNFKGLAELIHSVDYPVVPLIVPNWIENKGVAAGWNDGLRLAHSKGLGTALICNDDVTLGSGTIVKLIESLDNWDLVTALNMRGRTDIPEYGYIPHPDYSCFAVKTHYFLDKFGMFDENFYPAYFEDNDMAYRIRVSGGSQACRLDARMYHHGSVTQNMDGPVVSGHVFERNRSYYIRKWGGAPENERFTRPFNIQSWDINHWVAN